MDPEDGESTAVPLDSGIIFLTDEDLATAERQFLERKEHETSKAAETSTSSVVAVPVQSASSEAGTVAEAKTPTDPETSVDRVSPSPAQEESGDLFGSGSESSSGVQSPPFNDGDASDGDASDGDASDGDAGDEETSLVRSLLEWVMVLVGAVVVAMLLRAFLFQAFKIPSESMEATLQVQDRVMVNRVSYHLHDVERGDVIVFTTPPGIPAGEAHLIKRVIGLAGETIEGRDNAVYVNGQRVAEPYLDPADTILDFQPITIPEGTVFVMGDNRDDSGDSRIFGPIDTDTIVGRAFVIYWPLDRLDAI